MLHDCIHRGLSFVQLKPNCPYSLHIKVRWVSFIYILDWLRDSFSLAYLLILSNIWFYSIIATFQHSSTLAFQEALDFYLYLLPQLQRIEYYEHYDIFSSVLGLIIQKSLRRVELFRNIVLMFYEIQIWFFFR